MGNSVNLCLTVNSPKEGFVFDCLHDYDCVEILSFVNYYHKFWWEWLTKFWFCQQDLTWENGAQKPAWLEWS